MTASACACAGSAGLAAVQGAAFRPPTPVNTGQALPGGSVQQTPGLFKPHDSAGELPARSRPMRLLSCAGALFRRLRGSAYAVAAAIALSAMHSFPICLPPCVGVRGVWRLDVCYSCCRCCQRAQHDAAVPVQAEQHAADGWRPRGARRRARGVAQQRGCTRVSTLCRDCVGCHEPRAQRWRDRAAGAAAARAAKGAPFRALEQWLSVCSVACGAFACALPCCIVILQQFHGSVSRMCWQVVGLRLRT